jgi:hypothetical protein
MLPHPLIPNVDILPKDGSSLDGQRSISDFFKILDVIISTQSLCNDYKLQRLDSSRVPLAVPPLERSSPRNITGGDYLMRKFSITHMWS